MGKLHLYIVVPGSLSTEWCEYHIQTLSSIVKFLPDDWWRSIQSQNHGSQTDGT